MDRKRGEKLVEKERRRGGGEASSSGEAGWKEG